MFHTNELEQRRIWPALLLGSIGALGAGCTGSDLPESGGGESEEAAGKVEFEAEEDADEGLGPVFNERSCAAPTIPELVAEQATASQLAPGPRELRGAVVPLLRAAPAAARAAAAWGGARRSRRRGPACDLAAGHSR